MNKIIEGANNIDMYDNITELLEELKRIISYDTATFEQKYKINIDDSRKLGEKGWVINDFVDDKKWISKLTMDESCFVEEVEDHIDEMIETIYHNYKEMPYRMYCERAIENYRIGHYTESAMMFVSLLDHRLNVRFVEHFKKNKQVDDINDLISKFFNKFSDKLATKKFFCIDFLPSFAEYIRRLFVNGNEYAYPNGEEPPYLNRNYLMHGAMSRPVRRYECVQLINALYVLADIENELNKIVENNESQEN